MAYDTIRVNGTSTLALTGTVCLQSLVAVCWLYSYDVSRDKISKSSHRSHLLVVQAPDSIPLVGRAHTVYCLRSPKPLMAVISIGTVYFLLGRSTQTHIIGRLKGQGLVVDQGDASPHSLGYVEDSYQNNRTFNVHIYACFHGPWCIRRPFYFYFTDWVMKFQQRVQLVLKYSWPTSTGLKAWCTYITKSSRQYFGRSRPSRLARTIPGFKNLRSL